MDIKALKNNHSDLDNVFAAKANPLDRCRPYNENNVGKNENCRCKKNQKIEILYAAENCKDEFDLKEENGSIYLRRTFWSKQNITPVKDSDFCLRDNNVAEFLFCVNDPPADWKFK